MLTVATIMQTKPTTVPPEMTLVKLERLFLTTGYTGFPVLRGEKPVGVVSRSDIVRALLTERSRAEQISDYYAEAHPLEAGNVSQTLDQVATQVGQRLDALSVEDVMSHQVVSVGSSEPLPRLAALMLEGHMHRLPVVDDDRLVGVVTSMDLVRAVAQGRLVESPTPPSGERLLG